MVDQGECPAHWNFRLPPSLCHPECPLEQFLLLSFLIINNKTRLKNKKNTEHWGGEVSCQSYPTNPRPSILRMPP